MLVAQVGEFGLLDRLRAIVEKSDDTVLLGIGDDAAVVTYPHHVVMTTDAMVYGIHFREDLIGDVAIGYKAVVASLSDIAAMGAKPMHLLITLAVSQTQEVEQLEAIYRGIKIACDRYDVTVIGGDIVSTPGPMMISVTATGTLYAQLPLKRSGASTGDLVFVTGDIGGSGAYIDYRKHHDRVVLSPEDIDALQRRHQEPTPQILAGELLAHFKGCTSTNDISDGLASELHEIAAASGVGIVIEADRLPICPAVRHYAKRAQRDAESFALYGGEDYQIVGTVSPTSAGALLAQAQAQGIRVSLIGRVIEDTPQVTLIDHGHHHVIGKNGYDHFRQKEDE